MPSPRNRPWLPYLLLMIGAGLGLGTGFWWRGDGGNADPKLDTPEVLTGSWWVEERWLSAEQIEAAVSRMSVKELQDFFAGDGQWYRQPNGPGVFRAMVRRLISLEDPANAVSVVFDWVRRQTLTVATRANLFREVAEILAAKEGFDGLVFASLVRQLPREDLKALLEGWLAVRPMGSPEMATEFARQWLIAAGLPDDKEIALLAQSISLLAWMKREPERAIQYAAKSDRMAVRSVLIPELRRALAIDPQSATRLLKAAIEGRVYPEACSESAFLAGFTPAQLRAATKDLPREKIIRFLELYAARMFDRVPDELVGLAAEFPAAEAFSMWDKGDRVLPHGLFAIASGLAQTDPKAARDWLSTLSAEHRLRVLEGIWSFPGLENARIAQVCIEEPKFIEGLSQSKTHIFQALADGDLSYAVRALELIPPESRDGVETSIRLSKIFKNHRGDIASALSEAEAAPEKLKAKIRHGLVSSFASDDPQQVHHWIQSHPEDRDEMEIYLLDSATFGKDRASEELIAQRLARDPSDTMAWNWVNRIAEARVESDPLSVAQWLSQLPDRANLYPVISSTAGQSYLANGEATGTWVKGLPDGAIRSEATAGIALAIRHEPDLATEWANSISDEQRRYSVVRNLVDSWANADSAQTMKIVEDAVIQDSQRKELRERVENRRRFGKEPQ